MKTCKRGHFLKGPNLKTTPTPAGMLYTCRACEKLERSGKGEEGAEGAEKPGEKSA